jgi:hypothetical protein
MTIPWGRARGLPAENKSGSQRLLPAHPAAPRSTNGGCEPLPIMPASFPKILPRVIPPLAEIGSGLLAAAKSPSKPGSRHGGGIGGRCGARSHAQLGRLEGALIAPVQADSWARLPAKCPITCVTIHCPRRLTGSGVGTQNRRVMPREVRRPCADERHGIWAQCPGLYQAGAGRYPMSP